MSPEIFKEHPGISVNNEFAGLVSSERFSLEQAQKLIFLHVGLIDKYNLTTPYAAFTDEGRDLSFKPVRLGEDLILKAGPIGSFSAEEIAVFIQEQSRNYVDRTTMGRGFPRGDIRAEEELLAVFIDGFSRDDVFIIVEKELTEGIAALGGARIVRGVSERTLKETASYKEYLKKGTLSSLPTFTAVKLKELNGFSSDFFDVPELNCACITRYWREDDYTLAALEVNNTQIPVDIIAAMPLAYSVYIAKEKGFEDVPKVAVYDIHRRGIVEFARDNFASQIIADGEEVVPTREVLDSVLKYHYGGQELEGYQGKIVVGGFYTSSFLKRSLKYLEGRAEFDDSALQIAEDVIESGVNFPPELV